MLIDTDALRKRMVDCGYYSMTALAKASRISTRTIVSVMKNETRPAKTTIDRLVDALKLQPEEAGAIFFNRKLRNTQAQ